MAGVESGKRVLVGDIGGTSTRLAIARSRGGEVVLDDLRTYPSGDFSGLGACVRTYLDEGGHAGELEESCEAASFAVAGPVVDGRCATTNLAWVVDAAALAAELGLGRVALLNDLEAVAWAVPALTPDQVDVLQPGSGPGVDGRGNMSVVAAGTGLGVAGLCFDGQRHHAFATEGGHADFAPVTELERALLAFAARTHGRVSWERIVSGMGIGAIYAFLLEHRGAVTPAWLADEFEAEGGDLAAAVAGAAAREACPICVETMAVLFELYGRVAGNLALAHMALGGVYLGGGVTQRNLGLLRRSAFVERFCDKGRMRPLMERMPVRVILDEHVGLRGAARYPISAG